MSEIEDIVIKVAEVCKKNKIEYVIVGGVAVSSWGNVRTTKDVDMLLSLDSSNISKFLGALKDAGFEVDEEGAIQALKEKTHFTVFYGVSDFHIDAKGLYNRNDLETFKRRKGVKLGNILIYFNSPEDLIANKLLFGSEQDMKDAEGVYLRQHGKLDMLYLAQKCKRLGVYKSLIELQKNVDKYLKRG